MILDDYVKIIVDGLNYRKDYLSDHFWGEYKKAEEKHIGYVEFFKNLSGFSIICLEDIKSQHYEKLNKIQLWKGQCEQKGRIISEGDIKALTPDMKFIKASLPKLTNGKFHGSMSLYDVEKIQNAIAHCNNKYETEAALFEAVIKSNEKSGKILTSTLEKPLRSFKLGAQQLKNIGDMLDTLHDGELVSTKVKLPQFRKAFNRVEVLSKIEWLGSIGALHYFIVEICKYSLVKDKKWSIANNCFFIENIELTPGKLSNNKTISKKDKKTILTAISHFK